MLRRRSAKPLPSPPPPTPPREARPEPPPPPPGFRDPLGPPFPLPPPPEPPPPAPTPWSAAPAPTLPAPLPPSPGTRKKPHAVASGWDGTAPAGGDAGSAWVPSGPDRGRRDRTAPSPIDPGGAPDVPSSLPAPDGNADATGSLDISRTASGEGLGLAGGGSATALPFAPKEGVEGPLALTGESGGFEEEAGADGVSRSGKDTDTALISVTKRAWRVAGGPGADPARKARPPRRSA